MKSSALAFILLWDTTKGSIYSAGYNKGWCSSNCSGSALRSELEFQIPFKQKGNPVCTFSHGQCLSLPSFPACCVNPTLLPVGSVPHRLLKYWHLHVTVFFLLLPGSIKEPVFPLSLLYFFCVSSSSWEGKLNACDEVIPVCWHLLLQIISIKNKLPMFWGFCPSHVTNWVTFWSLWTLCACSYPSLVPTTAIFLFVWRSVYMEVCIRR